MSFQHFMMTGTTLALLTSAVALGACTTTEEEPDGSTSPYATESGFCAALAEAECNDQVVTGCFGSDEASLPSDRSKCISARKNLCNPQGLDYNSGAAQTCIAARRSALADAQLTMVELAAAEKACLEVFSRGGASGASCSADVDCDTADDLRCVIKPGAASGNCAEPTFVDGGVDCSAPNAVCNEGFYCSAESGNICREQPAEGDDCSASAPCAEGFNCSVATGGVCLAKGQGGDSCASAGECAGGFCSKPTGAANGTCTSTDQLTSTSQSCDSFR